MPILIAFWIAKILTMINRLSDTLMVKPNKCKKIQTRFCVGVWFNKMAKSQSYLTIPLKEIFFQRKVPGIEDGRCICR